jgi:hypothetical protein
MTRLFRILCRLDMHNWDYDPESTSLSDCACRWCGQKGEWNPYMWT